MVIIQEMYQKQKELFNMLEEKENHKKRTREDNEEIKKLVEEVKVLKKENISLNQELIALKQKVLVALNVLSCDKENEVDGKNDTSKYFKTNNTVLDKEISFGKKDWNELTKLSTGLTVVKVIELLGFTYEGKRRKACTETVYDNLKDQEKSNYWKPNELYEILNFCEKSVTSFGVNISNRKITGITLIILINHSTPLFKQLEIILNKNYFFNYLYYYNI
jgi:hypothetical protein